MPKKSEVETLNPITQTIANSVKQILDCFEEEREGIKDTPKRVAKMYAELLTPQEFNFTTFDANGYDQMIVQTEIQFYSLCEHHMIPFFGTVAIGYIPDKKIVGLSKLSRTVEYFARRLQTQEYMTQHIANFLEEKLVPKGIGVIIKARHLCQEMRGVRKIGAETTTSALKGVLLDKQTAREEFLSFV